MPQKDLQPFHLRACLEACLQTARREMFLKTSKGTIAYDTSFAKSKVPFASTIATFRGRSFEPAVVVLYKNFHMGFSGDAHLRFRVKRVYGLRIAIKWVCSKYSGFLVTVAVFKCLNSNPGKLERAPEAGKLAKKQKPRYLSAMDPPPKKDLNGFRV